MLLKKEFNYAVKRCGYPKPPQRIYHYLAEATKDYERWELAMLLANMIYESNGFQNPEAQAVEIQNYNDKFELPDESYHGRGYIRINRGINYRRASNDLGLGDKLLRFPKLIAEDIKLCVRVSIWFWEIDVRNVFWAFAEEFGYAARAVSGVTENYENALRRYKIYQIVGRVMNLKKITSNVGYDEDRISLMQRNFLKDNY